MSDLKELINSLSEDDVIDIVQKLGADKFQKTHNAIIFKTICHHLNPEDGSMKLYYYPKTHNFYCYTQCGCCFNIIELFKKRYELNNVQYDFYKDIVLKIGGGAIKRDNFSFLQPYAPLYEKINNTPEVDITPLNKGLLNAFTFYPTQEWLDDGIKEEVMRRYNILYSIIDNKIIIPHYDINGNLIGIRGRPLNQEEVEFGKYMPVKIEGKLYNHPLGYNLYGLNLVKENIKKYRMAIIAEGEKSPLQYESMLGEENNIVVASCGNNISKYQIDLLIKCGAERILIAFDKEGETWKEQEKYFNKLKKLCERYKNYATMGFVWDTKNLLKLKQSPFDCGPEVAKTLIKKGVWI